MGRIEKGEKCTIKGCGNPAIRSLAAEKVTKAGLQIEGSRRAYL